MSDMIYSHIAAVVHRPECVAPFVLLFYDHEVPQAIKSHQVGVLKFDFEVHMHLVDAHPLCTSTLDTLDGYQTHAIGIETRVCSFSPYRTF